MTEALQLTVTAEYYGAPVQITRGPPREIHVQKRVPAQILEQGTKALLTRNVQVPVGTTDVYVVVTDEFYGGIDEIMDVLPVFYALEEAKVHQQLLLASLEDGTNTQIVVVPVPPQQQP